MKVSELQEVHPYYTKHVTEWRFLLACYEGAKELISLGYLKQNERESTANYERRLEEAYGFGYSKSVIDLLCFYLFKKPVKRDLGDIQNDEQWNAFSEDCNLYGDDLDTFLHTQARYASIMGHVGILVDKASVEFENKQAELEAGVYPYLASYFPTAILDWKFERDEYNRPFLAYLKLKDDDDKYRLWYPDKWEVYEEPEVPAPPVPKAANQQTTDTGTISTAGSDLEAELVDSGENPLGAIPFVWLYNVRSKTIPLGTSDIHDVGRIDVSIMCNLSQGEEIISYAAFPMMRKPMQEAGAPSGPDEVGVTAVLEFDPENPESKPDWLDAQVAEPIDAILTWIGRKVEEIYRAANTGGMASTEIQTTAKSGVALRTEFQLLNSKLVSKATNLEKAEVKLIDFWLQWQENEEAMDKVTIERERTYDIENLAEDLENALTSMTIVKARKFLDAVRKQVVRRMLPGYTDEQISELDDEIENMEDMPPVSEAAFQPGAGQPFVAPEPEPEEE
ncbi:MAG: hypothetical protein DRJ03_01290 [Chloroflexi bacterium]|nr:MAG: hypothetical protein DRJ03_01290 [Chloroflexota bacterium]